MFRAHVKEKRNKATRLLMAGRQALGKNWGLVPDQVKWLYTSVVCPAVCHGSAVWVCRLPKVCGPLIRLKRLALMMLGSFPRRVPTEGLETIFVIPLYTWS